MHMIFSQQGVLYQELVHSSTIPFNTKEYNKRFVRRLVAFNLTTFFIPSYQLSLSLDFVKTLFPNVQRFHQHQHLRITITTTTTNNNNNTSPRPALQREPWAMAATFQLVSIFFISFLLACLSIQKVNNLFNKAKWNQSVKGSVPQKMFSTYYPLEQIDIQMALTDCQIGCKCNMLQK